MGNIEIVELPSTGHFDLERARNADVLLHNGKGTQPPLFWVRAWSQNGLYVRDLAAHLGSEQPVYSLAPPRFEEREAYPETVDQWTDFMLTRISALPNQDSYRIGGYSFGGVIALEVAERLAAEGAEVPLVLLFDTWLPRDKETRVRRAPRKHRSKRLARLSKTLQEYVEIPTPRERRAYLWRKYSPTRRAHRREARHERRQKKEEPPQAGFLGDDAIPEGQIMFDARGVEMSFLKRAVYVAFFKYTHRPTGLPIALIYTQGSREKAGDSSLGWSRLALGPFRSLPARGGHFDMFDAPHLPALARQIDRILRDTEAAS
jgi:thioesterase domain-containing protein